MCDPDLTGHSILLVEDEHLIVRSLVRLLGLWGAQIVGPVPTAEKALTLLQSAQRVDGAVVDINLRGGRSFQVADVLSARRVPFVFTTGYDASVIPQRHRQVPVFQKPFDAVEVARALVG